MPEKKNTKKFTIESYKIRKYLKLYVLPLVAILLFLMIVFVLIIPRLSSLLAALDEIGSINQQIAEQDKKITELRALSEKSNLMLAQLKVLDETTPTGTTEVVKFRNKVTEIIQNYNLTITSQRYSENSFNPAEDQDPSRFSNLTLREVPSTYEIAGPYRQVIDFIEELSTIDDFIIIREMELKGSGGGSDVWTLEVRMDKYQFNVKNQEQLDIVYINVPSDVQVSQSVLDYINNKMTDQ